ncbi:hypothetical protein OAD32_01890, partial [Porticoccaceae bacterium]|nr:hypothetical protein [Porticoccaceae bacterium]
MSDDVSLEQVEPVITLHIGFLLMPEYTLSTFSNAVGILRMANRLSGRELYRWSTYTLTGDPVISSSALEIRPDGPLHSA